MKKKEYIKPSMTVIPLRGRPRILAGSNGGVSTTGLDLDDPIIPINPTPQPAPGSW